jgi:chorismate mutase
MRALKAAHALPRVDPEREARMHAVLEAEARVREVPTALVHAVLDAILADSRALVSSGPRE